MRLIGLNGRAGSGKDTAFDVIRNAAQAQEKVAQRVAFADKLKLSAARALGYDPKTVEDAVELCNMIKDTGCVDTAYDRPAAAGTRRGIHISGRAFLQRYGTEAHRDVFGDSFWIDALLPKPALDGGTLARPAGAPHPMNAYALEQRFPDADVVVITDVRFENEAQRIRALGGENWHIDADARLGELPADAHVSEHGLPEDYIDQRVYNNCDLYEFRKRVVEAFQS
jgi:hypothetical protein